MLAYLPLATTFWNSLLFMPLLWQSAGPAWYFIPLYTAALWAIGRIFKK